MKNFPDASGRAVQLLAFNLGVMLLQTVELHFKLISGEGFFVLLGKQPEK